MTDYPANTIAAMASWLCQRMGRLRQHEAAAEIVAGVTRAVRQAQRAIDRPPQRVYAGPCPHCGADLLGRPGAVMVTCDGCGNGYDVAARQAAMRAGMDDLLGSATWCASAAASLGLRVSAGTIRVWASRRRIEQRPGELYRFGDVVALALARDAAKAG